MNETEEITVPIAVAQMLAIIARLEHRYPHKKFTLDGRLVGDLGEVLVEDAYALKLYLTLEKFHDGETEDGRKVQIKATMKGNLTFPAGHEPEFYLGIHIHPDGTFEEVFNGPGSIAKKAISNRAIPKTNLHSISASALKQLQREVPETMKIPRRANN